MTVIKDRSSSVEHSSPCQHHSAAIYRLRCFCFFYPNPICCYGCTIVETVNVKQLNVYII